MRMQCRQPISIVLFFLLISFVALGCGEEKKAAKAPVVSKKIAVQNKAKIDPKSDAAKTEASSVKQKATAPEEEGSQAMARIYDPKQRINPFIPVFGAKKDAGDTKSRKRKKRLPQTPLERISLDQLKLVAIIRASSGNRALVEDTIGKGYIIKNGTYIGLNSGMVTQINANSVIVEEELENLKGELVLQSTEIKLQKPAGE